MLKTDFVNFICVPVVLSLVQSVCAADKFPDYPLRKASDYEVTSQQAGLTIGVQPVEDPKEQKVYFNTEFAPKGFMPVFLVVQNGSSTDSFLFDKTKLTYGEGDSTGKTPDARSQAGEAVAVMSLAAISLAGAFVAMKLISNASQIQQDILKKEVQSKTLSPGTSVHGFLYIPVPKKGPRQKIRLQVPVTHVGSDETFILNVNF